ncbi:MAG: DnaJ domain-containing protein [Clostridiales bacterium]|nr:DnaJ domain-containing protein [Clostridiales bacterium]
MKDPYQVLGVSRDASEQEVTAAFRRLAKKYHPDLNPGDDTAQKRMAEINVAYEEIKSGRARYQDYSRPQAGPQRQGYGGYGGFNPFEGFGQWQQQTQQRSGPDGFDPVRRYVNAMRYNEALYALSQIHTRSAEWYYLSAVAHYGLGNRVSALNHIDEAVRLEPNNYVYLQARAQIQSQAQGYAQRSYMFGMPSLSSLNTLCLGLCLARLCCRC